MIKIQALTYRTTPLLTNKIVGILLFYMMLTSCSVTKNIPEEASLYLKPEVTFIDSLHPLKGTERRAIKDLPVPEANKQFLGLVPLRLHLYQLAPDSTGNKGLGNWLKNKAGEAPVLFEPRYTERSEKLMRSWLFNRGFFDARVNSSLKQYEKTTQPHYSVNPQKPYLIDTIIYAAELQNAPIPLPEPTELQNITTGKTYKLEALKKERARLSESLQNKGFFYFYENYLLFQIDTNTTQKTLDLYVTLAKDIPEKAFHKYHISRVQVFPDYQLEEGTPAYDTVIEEGIYYLQTRQNLRPAILNQSIWLKPGDLYSHESYRATLNKLMGLDIFKYANIKFQEDPSVASDSSALLMDIYLTQTMPVSTRAEVQVVTKSNDFSGPLFLISYINRNLRGGAENLQLDLNGGFESQWSGRGENYFSYEIGSALRLSFPRFLFPFVDLNKFLSKRYTPKTDFLLEYTRINRTDYYTSNALEANVGYRWQETADKYHNLRVISLNYHRLFNTSQKFDELLAVDPLLQESFKEKFILGSQYRYTYTPSQQNLPSISRLGVTIDIAGNLLQGIKNTTQKSSESNEGKLFGLPYSQYAKASTDVRTHLAGNSRLQLVNRTIIGLAVPYGNSSSLPHSKQFYVGGANSLRGFQYRSLGPGGTLPESDNNLFVHNGNIKVETSLELRFPIAGPVKSALFLDAGNVWMWEDTESQPSAGFSFSDLGKELAVNTGVGVRLDISFLVFRLDVGIPLRTPYMLEGSHWIPFRPFQKTWISDYPVLNIAIGYPF